MDLVVFINKEDHLNITSKDSNLLTAYTRAINFAQNIEGDELYFLDDHHLGFVTHALQNLGTGLTVTV